MKGWGQVGSFVVAVLLLGMTPSLAQQSLKVRVDRWLELQKLSGTVLYQHGSVRQSARVGNRLQAVGDQVSTGPRSSAMLAVDTGIGTIDLTENTNLRVQRLDVSPDNGRITRLQVTQGQVRLKLRRFTNGSSRLEIQTPASVSGVRGTEFGVAIQPNGKTGLAVLQGGVSSGAQGTAVSVPAGFQNFTNAGEPPSPPVPITNDTSLKHRFELVIDRGVRRVRLVGQVDPVNRVLVAGIPQNTDRSGRFQTEFQPLPSFLKLQVLVQTPLGKQEVYELAFD